ncbi:hypothetical protein PLESTB_001288200 [Pleodorina starrii]|uniref:Uncharacterized protein n=1 Tax=Pleodorina starrii TaxID=330485 RepID=A0A9W6BTX0_9CHLO|nr:hypothetical protein PLESTB_001288200 [Pleodorina starrii]
MTPGTGSTAAMPYYIALHVRPYPDTCFEYFAGMRHFDGAAAAKVCRNPRLLLRMVPLVRQLLHARATATTAAAHTTAAVNISTTTATTTTSTTSSTTAAAATASPPVPAALFVMSHPRVREVLRRELRRLWAAAESEAAAAAGGGGGRGGGLPPPPLPALFFLDSSYLPEGQLRNHVATNSLLSMVEQEVCRMAGAFVGTKASSISVLVAQERVAAAADYAAAEAGKEGNGAGVLIREAAAVEAGGWAGWNGTGGGGGGGGVTILL